MNAGSFRKKPVEIRAIQYVGIHTDEIKEFMGDQPYEFDPGAGIRIATLEGVMLAEPYDWIIRGVAGELYPCKPAIFQATYESAAALADCEPQLGCATTAEMLSELMVRAEIGGYARYRTVDSDE
jgi:hypothetical protein